jgi:hypothetical protein
MASPLCVNSRRGIPLQSAFLQALGINLNTFRNSETIRKLFFNIYRFISHVQKGDPSVANRTFRLSKTSELPTPRTLAVFVRENKIVELIVYKHKNTFLGKGRFLVTKKAQQILVYPKERCVVNNWTVKRSFKDNPSTKIITAGIERHKMLMERLKQQYPFDARCYVASVPTYFHYTTKSGDERLEVFQEEYVGTLRDLHRVCHPLMALRMLKCVAQGLSKIHAVGLVHSDLSKDNILLGRFDPALISDFDFAGMIGDKYTPQDYWLWDHARLHGFLTPNCDMFAFAVLVVEMLAPEILDAVAAIELKFDERVISPANCPKHFILKLEKFLFSRENPSLHHKELPKFLLFNLLRQELVNSKKLNEFIKTHPHAPIPKNSESWQKLQVLLNLSTANGMLQTLKQLENCYRMVELRDRNIMPPLIP